MSFLDEATINHFSHAHPLHLFNHQDQFTTASCSGCKLEATGLIYTCTTCNYYLHIKCAKMPRQITHPFDQGHAFTLLAKPLYAEGLFNCDACGKHGKGFSYHCKVCKIDLHILCAVAPLSIRHQSHMDHQLNLISSPPYPNKVFNCDICNAAGFNHWLYRCDFCNFDVHLDCKNVPMRERNFQQIQASRSPIQIPQVPNYQAFRPQYTATGIPLQNLMPSGNINVNQASHGPVMPYRPRQNMNGDLMALHLLQGFPNNSSSQNIYIDYFLQTLAAAGGIGEGGVGSGGGGDLAGQQQLYQFFSGIHAGGIGGLGGGLGGQIGGDVGGMQQLYQSFSGISAGGGGGIGGVPGLNRLGNVEGGGILNVLQTLMGGDGGSSALSGGLDALIGLLGGFSL